MKSFHVLARYFTVVLIVHYQKLNAGGDSSRFQALRYRYRKR